MAPGIAGDVVFAAVVAGGKTLKCHGLRFLMVVSVCLSAQANSSERQSAEQTASWIHGVASLA